jgi:hypothetical protein
MKLTAQQEAVVLRTEAVRRMRQALRQIESAQGELNSACATLSSLQYAMPEWRATSKLADRVKAHWYKVRNALEYGPRGKKMRLDPLAAEGALEALHRSKELLP